MLRHRFLDTVSPRIYFKTTTRFGRSRNCLATRTSARRPFYTYMLNRGGRGAVHCTGNNSAGQISGPAYADHAWYPPS